MVFGPFARFTAERGFARRADRSQMLEALGRAEEAGLVHVSDNIQDKINFICNCCGFLQGIARYRIPNEVATSRFLAVVDSEFCTGCEACIDRYQTKAIRSGGKKVETESRWCIGCGLCVSECPEDAISYEERKDYRPPWEGINKLRMTVFQEVSRQEK
jgi:electron transport complex protein RnfB